MKYEDKKTLTLSILMILILAGFSYYNSIKVKKIKSSPGGFVIDLPDIELPPLDTFTYDDLNQLIQNHDSQISYLNEEVDGFTFDYPSHWTLLEAITDEDYGDLAEVLFVLQSPDTNPSVMAISKLKADSLDESLDVINQIFSKEGTTLNVTTEKEIDNGLYLEIKYRYSDGQIAKSKEKIIKKDDTFYLFSAVVHEALFTTHQEQIEHFINSIEIK